MKAQKIKRYRLGVSRNFPTTHARKGEQTWFIQAILNELNNHKETLITCYDENYKETNILISHRKLHTIRSNYELWAKRMAEVLAGRAVIELFYWSGKPYRSKQIVFAVLDKNSGCGVQELDFIAYNIERPCIFGNGYAARNHISTLAKNDGLLLDDFKAWFKGYDLSQPMAIIQFTKYRY